MKVGSIEKEKYLFSILKRAKTEHLEPHLIRTIHSRIVFKRITDVYGKEALSDLYNELIENKLIEYRGGFYRLTSGGKRVLKRGYVYVKVSKYASPEYSFCISVLALAVSILNSDWFWNLIRCIHQAIEGLYSVWLTE